MKLNIPSVTNWVAVLMKCFSISKAYQERVRVSLTKLEQIG